jgi:hypothetical protein
MRGIEDEEGEEVTREEVDEEDEGWTAADEETKGEAEDSTSWVEPGEEAAAAAAERAAAAAAATAALRFFFLDFFPVPSADSSPATGAIAAAVASCSGWSGIAPAGTAKAEVAAGFVFFPACGPPIDLCG